MKDFKLPSRIEMVVLRLLMKKHMYGLEMVKASKLLKRGAIYVTLNRMEDKGLVSSKVNDSLDAAGRRIYNITAEGRKAYGAWEYLQKAHGFDLAGVQAYG